MIKRYFIAPINDNVWMLAGMKESGSYVWYESETGSHEVMKQKRDELNRMN